MTKKWYAEFLGTFWLVFGGCGSAVIAPGISSSGIGLVGVSLAFGLTVVSMAYTVGNVSGAHFNPAVTLGFVSAGRFKGREALGYISVQIIGALAATAVLALIVSSRVGSSLSAHGLAANGFGEHSPAGYSMSAVLLTEVLTSFIFLTVILRVTADRSRHELAPLAIGLTLTLIHLVTIPISNTSVNPARSTGPALLMGGWALSQLWMFWLAPVSGAVLAGLVDRKLAEHT